MINRLYISFTPKMCASMLCVANAQCFFAEYCYAKCNQAVYHYGECHYAECQYAECHYAEGHIMLSVDMLSVVMLNLVMLSVVAPVKVPLKGQQGLTQWQNN